MVVSNNHHQFLQFLKKSCLLLTFVFFSRKISSWVIYKTELHCFQLSSTNVNLSLLFKGTFPRVNRTSNERDSLGFVNSFSNVACSFLLDCSKSVSVFVETKFSNYSVVVCFICNHSHDHYSFFILFTLYFFVRSRKIVEVEISPFKSTLLFLSSVFKKTNSIK